MAVHKTARRTLCLLLCLFIFSLAWPSGAGALGTPSKPSSRTPGGGANSASRSYGYLPIWWVEASSTRIDSEFRDKQGNHFTYPAENLYDGKPDTCWVPALLRNQVGNGVGDYVDFYFEYSAVIAGISVLNGYCKSKDLFYANSRPAKLEISFLYAGNNYFTDEVYAELKDGYLDYQTFSIPEREDVEAVRVRIAKVYGGTKYYGDVCISEIRIIGAWM